MLERFRAGELLNVCWIHPEQIPDMTVEVFESPAEHETFVVLIVELTAAKFECLLGKFAHFISGFARQRNENFDCVLVGNLFIDE